jgi:hypothetical protein
VAIDACQETVKHYFDGIGRIHFQVLSEWWIMTRDTGSYGGWNMPEEPVKEAVAIHKV